MTKRIRGLDCRKGRVCPSATSDATIRDYSRPQGTIVDRISSGLYAMKDESVLLAFVACAAMKDEPVLLAFAACVDPIRIRPGLTGISVKAMC